ncbi:DUF4446 family protein [Dethiothermospora halolimnae]|uniref:DUF4446 family protein n=1 Tax=Dethiothermospora halolimnae TaxID=3114390 RepID=UPI003CCB9D31
MGSIIDIINNNSEIIILSLSILSLLLLVLFIISQIRISSIAKKYNRLMDGADGNSIEEMLIDHIDNVNSVKGDITELKGFCEDLDKRLRLSIKNVGFIRYSAFENVGSDLSFSIALMDENLDGFVITSIYGREESNTYAKPIENGKSSYVLSEEELKAVDRGIKGLKKSSI